MSARISAFVIWSLVAATAVFWLLRLTVSTPQAPANAVAVAKSVAVRGDLNRLFGAPPVVMAAVEATPAAPSRFKLVGVMAPRSGPAQAAEGQGLALIAVDGKPPKAFAVGAQLDSGLVLQSVGLRTAALGPAQGARSVLLELPALLMPATGVLPPAGSPAQIPPGLSSSPRSSSGGQAVPGQQGSPSANPPPIASTPQELTYPRSTENSRAPQTQ